jgi:hypothetical protein
MADLLSHYQALNKIVAGGGPDGAAAAQAKLSLERYINDLGAGNTIATPGMTPTMAPEDVGTTLQTANANTRSAMNANKISGELDPAATGFIERAEGRSGTGRKLLADQLADRATKILESNKDVSSLLPDEVAALKKVQDGTATQNVMEWAAKRFSGLGPMRQLILF